MVYSTEHAKPYLTQKGIMNLRSAFAKDVFADDLLSIYEKQTEHRNALRAQSRDVIAEIVSRINSGAYDIESHSDHAPRDVFERQLSDEGTYEAQRAASFQQTETETNGISIA